MPPCPLHSTCHHQAAAAVVLTAAVAAHSSFAPATDVAVDPAAAHQNALPAAYGAVLDVGVVLDEATWAAALHAAASWGLRYGSSLLLQGAA